MQNEIFQRPFSKLPNLNQPKNSINSRYLVSIRQPNEDFSQYLQIKTAAST